MAKRKKQPVYTADEMRQLKERLIERRLTLIDTAIEKLEQLRVNPNCEGMYEVRDPFKYAAMISHVLENVIDTSIKLAEIKQEAMSIPFLDECGLED